MVHFNSIKLNNFRNISDAYIELQNINILVGSNNSGKSNFLAIAEILKNLVRGGEEGRNRFQQEFLGPQEQENFKFELNYLVINENERKDCWYHIEIEKPFYTKNAEGKVVISSFKIKNESLHYKDPNVRGPQRMFFKRQYNRLEFGKTIGDDMPEIELENKVSALEIFSSLKLTYSDNNELLIKAIYNFCETITFCIHRKKKASLSTYLKKLYAFQEDKNEQFLKFKRGFEEIINLTDFKITKISFTPSEDIYFGNVRSFPGKKIMTLESLSDGSKILFSLLYEAIFSSSELVFIDEPEVGLHPMALSKLFSFLRTEVEDKQLVIATHSSYLLNLADPKLVTLAEVKNDGTTVFVSVSEIPNLQSKLKSKFIHFGDLLSENFQSGSDNSLET